MCISGQHCWVLQEWKLLYVLFGFDKILSTLSHQFQILLVCCVFGGFMASWVHFCEAHDFQLCVLWTGRRWSPFLLVPPLSFGRGMPDVCVIWSNKFWNVTVSSGPGMLWLCLLLSVQPTSSTGQLHCDNEQQDGATAAGRSCLPSIDNSTVLLWGKKQIVLSAFKGEKLLMFLNSILSGLEGYVYFCYTLWLWEIHFLDVMSADECLWFSLLFFLSCIAPTDFFPLFFAQPCIF